jgi:hypothetical protein
MIRRVQLVENDRHSKGYAMKHALNRRPATWAIWAFTSLSIVLCLIALYMAVSNDAGSSVTSVRRLLYAALCLLIITAFAVFLERREAWIGDVTRVRRLRVAGVLIVLTVAIAIVIFLYGGLST